MLFLPEGIRNFADKSDRHIDASLFFAKDLMLHKTSTAMSHLSGWLRTNGLKQLLFSHRIHGAGIYANIKGVYWW